MSYHHARKAKVADQYLTQREIEKRAEKAIIRDRERLETARAWLADYQARSRVSSFDWRPRYVMTPPGATNAEEIIEGEFTECAQQGDESSVEKAEGS